MKVRSIKLLQEMEKEGYVKLLPTTGKQVVVGGKKSWVWCVQSPVGSESWEFEFRGDVYKIQYGSGGWMEPFVFKYN